jgi:hypothetical protein
MQLADKEIAEIERRLADHDRDSASAVDWREVRSRL